MSHRKKWKKCYTCVQNMSILAMVGEVDGVAMRSLLGPVLTNIFMTELEITMIPSL